MAEVAVTDVAVAVVAVWVVENVVEVPDGWCEFDRWNRVSECRV